MIRFNSLSFRLLALSTAWTLFVLPVTAIFLISKYQQSLERNFDSALSFHLTLLARTKQIEAGKLQIPDLPDPLFRLPFSGRYWQIKSIPTKENPAQIEFHSESLLDEALPLPSENGVSPDKNLMRIGYVRGPENQKLRVVEQEIALGEGGGVQNYSLAIARDSTEIDAELADFQEKLGWALTILGLGLILAPFVQIRFGLRPLGAISSGLAAIRSGQAQSLDVDLPDEIQPLQVELNALIQSNHDIVERARTHVGNLAHALKTPLSVITNAANKEEGAFARKVIEQSKLMQDQITHHLDRARMVARLNIVGGMTDVYPTLKPIIRALKKIYEERGLSFEMLCDKDLKFQGEKHDLEEMVGNLLDNACKWAKTEVLLKVELIKTEAAPLSVLKIVVEDDGPGLSREEMEIAMKRGRRLDETKPGSGLGLSIVADLAHLYKGSFLLEKSARGGLQSELHLPAA